MNMIPVYEKEKAKTEWEEGESAWLSNMAWKKFIGKGCLLFKCNSLHILKWRGLHIKKSSYGWFVVTVESKKEPDFHIWVDGQSEIKQQLYTEQ